MDRTCGKVSIAEAWNRSVFEQFRNSFRNACPDCDNRKQCMGGCPICPEIVLCNVLSKSRSSWFCEMIFVRCV